MHHRPNSVPPCLLTVLLVVLQACSNGSSSHEDAQPGADVHAVDRAAGFDVGSPKDDVVGDGICQPNCLDRDCGGDGCGGECGVCGPGIACAGGYCANGPDALEDVFGDVGESDHDVFGELSSDYGITDITGITDTSTFEDGEGFDGGWDTGQDMWLSDEMSWDASNSDYGSGETGNYSDAWSWDGINWDGFNWDDVDWDGISYDGYSWDGYNWDGYNWDGFGWDFGPMPDIGSEDCDGIDADGICEGTVLKYCVFGDLVIQDCAEYGAGCTCGYVDDFGFYDCDGEC